MTPKVVSAMEAKDWEILVGYLSEIVRLTGTAAFGAPSAAI